ncbi:hypothetical protein TrST_g824 [Triparma strigata]|uniref:Uncharacterized protein n=1 Tax=Triparma strigata TaxID=1606541 RepID=A0A9W7F3S8_9STRA|nr:hypothetical protein TrST_g824 [Triparma strigata]
MFNRKKAGSSSAGTEMTAMVPTGAKSVGFQLGDDEGGERTSMQVGLFSSSQSGRQTVIDALCKEGVFKPNPNKTEAAGADAVDIDIESGIATKAVKATEKLGTLFGVFLPCMQNILGVILFLRLPFITAQAGCIQATAVVMICVISTVLTGLSLSAIATNGKIQAGGPYYVISRNLGVEIGGALGILFYLGTTIAASMYVLGAVEAFQTGFDMKDQFFFDTQIESLILMLCISSVVFIGVKYVNMSSTVFLAVVFLSIFCLSLGVILFKADSFDGQLSSADRVNNDNIGSNYQPDPDTGQEVSFFSLLALFYPSVTGIMAGSNRSAVLADPGRSIPTGTLGAIGCTTFIYIFTIWLFGTSLANETLMNDKLIVTAVTYPHEIIVKIGIIMSCIGAGLQSMTGAPRLLAAIAEDDSIPFLRPFAPANPSDEPSRALWLTWFIASLPVLAGNLDFITPIITLFFLLMYAGVNFSCFILSILKAPGFRPSFKYFHWSTSLFGTVWCIGLGLVISWYVTLVAMFLFMLLYLYIRTQGAVKDWGDALRGLRYGIARDELLALAVKDNFHAKNWRPQMLVLVDIDENGNPLKPSLISFVGQLKKGRGLTMVASIFKGDILDPETCERARDAYAILKLHMKEEEVPGFVEVIPTNAPMSEAVWGAAIHSGLGPLSPNAVLMAWPDGASGKRAEEFVTTLKGLTNLNKAIFLMKGGETHPCVDDRVTEGGTIDVWWVVHDGGLLLLTPFLLSKHKVWRAGAKVRLFAVLTDAKENPLQVQKALQKHLADVRIEASVTTVDLSDTSIAGDMRQVYSKTADMQARRELLRNLDNPSTLSQAAGRHAEPSSHKTIAEVFSGMGMGLSQRAIANESDIAKSPIQPAEVKEARTKNNAKNLDEARMTTAVAFNKLVMKHSKDAKLVVTNLPLMRSVEYATDFVGYVETMLEGVDNAVMIRGAGKEVVTTYG